MRKMKKFVALAMTAVMAASLLIGCGGKSTTEDKTTKEEDTKKEVYVFIRDRGDLSYWDSMAEGADRSVKDFADQANVHVVETTADLQANLQAMYDAADAGADLIVTASDFKDNLVEVANEFPDIAFAIISEDVIDQ